MRSDSEERIANAGTGPSFTSTPAESHGKFEEPGEMELGQMRRGDPQIGTAITGGQKEDYTYGNGRGTIVKTMSIDQTYSDQHR